MTRQAKIEFLIKRLGDRITKEYLETKSDSFIDHVYTVEDDKVDSAVDEAMCSMF